MTQSKAEKLALDAVWQRRPEVVALRAALRERAERDGLGFDAEGMTALLKLACEWQNEHGVLPDSGIKCS